MSDRPLLPLSGNSAAPHPCPRPVRQEVLSRTPLFAELDPEEIIGLDGQSQAPGYQAGDSVYGVGDAADSMFVVASGAVKLMWPSAHGDHVVFRILGPGEEFGTLARQGQYTESAEAMTVTCVVKIPVRVVRDLMVQRPQLAMIALDAAFHRLQESKRTIGQLLVGSADQRIAAALLALADKLGYTHAGRIDLTVPLTRADLAGMSRTTPETVSRVLGRLRHEGVVDLGRGWTAVLDRHRLAALAHPGQSPPVHDRGHVPTRRTPLR